MYQVIDVAGRVIELEDDEIVPPNCSLRVPTFLMDSEQKAVKRATVQRLRTLDAYLDFKQRTGAGMHRHRIPTPAAKILPPTARNSTTGRPPTTP